MLKLYGALGSPYSMKVRAALRWLRRPHVWVQMGLEHGEVMTRVRPAVIPIVEFPDGTFANDSTPLLLDFSAEAPGDRQLLPDDPVARFLCLLIEDFADEWLTKVMFHYRWTAEIDQRTMSEAIVFDRVRGYGRDMLTAFAAEFRDRQVGRMHLVGCGAEQAPQLAETYRRLLAILEAMVPDRGFLFGSRPSLADFGLYGQLSQLAVDPTPSALMRRDAPLLWRWLMIVDDASGLEGTWMAGAAEADPAVAALARLAAEVYLPFLAANERALAAGDAEMAVPLLGSVHRQPVFKYQAKCLAALRVIHGALDAAARARLAPLLGPDATAILAA
ncbi:glutathione S-transferase family protein [Zavarzinia compransoris]|uniref:Glutathione S-transferase n=1 Tax=Zavarzinia compransoris TaxID=1264899 RepID=A0A317DYK1_9PROT|nr:glutathione S-transferase C-terminal domain-containing protein [Zavarzinia compransoris]PWR18073.1 glutathione S-transferase [Zavarzinia compransoris]TDP43453.1 glutathione S-transferase [Zavarzinia compransoris]